MIIAKPCTCSRFPFEHERYGNECVGHDVTQDWPDDERLDDNRRKQASAINRERYFYGRGDE